MWAGARGHDNNKLYDLLLVSDGGLDEMMEVGWRARSAATGSYDECRVTVTGTIPASTIRLWALTDGEPSAR